jgi:predicted small metal-binding protein
VKFSLSCGDVMPGCVARFESDSRDDVLGQVGAHAVAHHGITELTPDVLRSVESNIALSA